MHQPQATFNTFRIMCKQMTKCISNHRDKHTHKDTYNDILNKYVCLEDQHVGVPHRVYIFETKKILAVSFAFFGKTASIRCFYHILQFEPKQINKQ